MPSFPSRLASSLWFWTGSGLAILALTLISFICFSGLRSLQIENALVDKTYEIMADLEKIDAQTASLDRMAQDLVFAKSYSFPKSYQGQVKVLEIELSSLGKLIQDDPVQQSLFGLLQDSVLNKMSLFAQAQRSLSNGDLRTAVNTLRTATRPAAEDLFREDLIKMRLQEYELQNKFKDLLQKRVESQILLLGSAALGAFSLFALALWVIALHRRQKNAALGRLSTSEKKFKSMAQNANDSFITVDLKGNILEVNPATEALFGYPSDELVGQSLQVLMPERFLQDHPQDAFEQFLKLSSSENGVSSTELLARRKDGSEFPVEVTTYPWQSDEGSFYTILTRDITDRKFFTKMLLKNEHRLFQFLEAMPVAVLVRDQEGAPYYSNQAAKELFGIESIHQQSTLDKIPETHHLYLTGTDRLYPAGELPVAKALAGQNHYVDDIEIRNHGRVTPLNIWGKAILDDNGQIRFAMSVAVNVSHQRQITDSLKQREEFFRTLFEEGPIGMSLAFPDGTFVNVNQAFCNMLGYSKSELMGKTLFEVTAPEDRRADESLTHKLFEKILPRYQLEKRYVKKNGTQVWAKMSASLIRDENGDPLFRLEIAENITDQKEAELARLRSEESFRRIFEQSYLGMILVNLDGSMQNCNEAFARMLGYPREELIRTSFRDITHPEDHSSISQVMSLRSAPSKRTQLEKRYITRPGGLLWAKISSVLIEDNEGLPLSIFTIVEDITERKKAEEAAREGEERFRSLAESANTAIITADAQGRIIYFNPSAEVLFGYNRNEILGKPILILLPPHTHAERIPLIQNYLRTGQATIPGRTVEWMGLRKDGSEFPTEVSYFSWSTAQGRFFTGILKDITERKQIEDMKRDLISVVSHQLKTPVAEINGYIENMLEGLTGELVPRQKEYLLDMKRIGMENYRLISDLLSVSKIERGVITVDPRPVSLARIASLAVHDYEEMAHKKGLALHFDPGPADIQVLADQDKTVETVRNILNNALKCTDRGNIFVTLTEEPGYGIIEVADTGIGMNPETLSKLFTRDRVMGSEAGRSGAGLGLFIAKSFMTLQKGDILAESEKGKGSRFFVRIPQVKNRGENS